MNTIESRLSRTPKMRSSTLAYLYRRDAKLEQLRAEVEALHRANDYSTTVRRQPISIIERMKIIGLWMWRR